MAKTLWDTSKEDAEELLELLWNDALLLPGPLTHQGEPTYRLHDLLHDVARRLLEKPHPDGLGIQLSAAHATFLDRIRRHCRVDANGVPLWHTFEDDGYVQAHLTWHMDQAEKSTQVHTLLREETNDGFNGWYYACEQRGNVGGFVDDVLRAWQLLYDESHSSYHGNDGLEVRYALYLASLKSLAKNIPPYLLSALVQHRLWSQNKEPERFCV
jgi:hypothetical protein